MNYNKNEQWLLGQFYLINRTAKQIYEVVQGVIDQNFYARYSQYEDGVYGWAKEASSFQAGMNIYEDLLSNDGWDIINQIEGFATPQDFTVEEIESFKEFVE